MCVCVCVCVCASLVVDNEHVRTTRSRCRFPLRVVDACVGVWLSSCVVSCSPPHSWGVYSDTRGVNAFLHSGKLPYAWAAVHHTNTQPLRTFTKPGRFLFLWGDRSWFCYTMPKNEARFRNRRKDSIVLQRVVITHEVTCSCIDASCWLYLYTNKP